MIALWQAIIGFLGGPVIKGLLDAYNAKLKAGNTSEKLAVDLASGDMAAQTAERQSDNELKRAQIGHPFEPEKLAFYVVLFYMAKVMIWDAALHLGTTDAVKGEVALWAALVVSWYFGKRTMVSIADLIGRIFRK